MSTPARRRPLAPGLTRILATLATAALAALTNASSATGQTDSTVTREIIVKRERGLSLTEQAELRDRVDAELVQQLQPGGMELVRVRRGGVGVALGELRRDPSVVYAELNRAVALQGAEPLFGRLWGFRNIGQAIGGVKGRTDADADVDAAWKASRGSGEVVAMVDSGINLEHEDLRDVVRRNPGESGAGRRPTVAMTIATGTSTIGAAGISRATVTATIVRPTTTATVLTPRGRSPPRTTAGASWVWAPERRSFHSG